MSSEKSLSDTIQHVHVMSSGVSEMSTSPFYLKKDFGFETCNYTLIACCLNPEKTFCEVGFLQKYVSNGDHRQLVASQGAIVLVKKIKKGTRATGRTVGETKKMFEGVETRRRGKYCPGSNASDYWESMGYFLRGASIWGKLGLKTKGKETWTISCFVDHKSFDSTWDLTLPTVVLERVAKQHPTTK